MFRHTLTKFFLAHGEPLLIIVLSAIATFSALTVPATTAATIQNRRVVIGSSEADAATSHAFFFDTVTPATLGSIVFEYCENSPTTTAPCTVPAGLDVDGVSLATQTGLTGFSVHSSTTTNRIVISRVPAAAAPTSVQFRFTNAHNPSDVQRSTFVRISTYGTDDGTGALTDEGAVVFSTARSLTVGGYVPPYLTFCVGVTVALNCSTTDGDSINLGELSRATPSTATSEFAAATNDLTGYSVGVYGNTMTSGNNLIPALAAGGGSNTGTSQYGLNLRRNTSPSVGQNPAGSGTADVTVPYSAANNFRFVNGESVASSPLPSNFNRFTVSYLVNVAGSQQPGVYATTMTFIATASF